MRALLITADAFGGHGGIAQYNRDLASAVAEFPGTTAVAVLPRFIHGPAGTLPPHVRQVTRAAGSRIGYLAAFVRELFRPRWDVVLCGHLWALPLARLAAAIHRAPLVLFIYGIEAWDPLPRPLSARWGGRMAKRVTRCVSITRLLGDRFAGWTGLPADRVVVIPPTVDVSRFSPGPRDPELVTKYGLTGHKVVLAFGRMDARERYKGFDELLAILPDLATKVPDVHYLFLGDGDDRPRLERRAAELGVAGRVTFGGFVPEDKKPDHYRLGDVFAQPSRDRGGFGIVFLEAIASGLPAVGSTVDGTREALLDGALGRIVDPADPQALAAALVAELTSPVRPDPAKLAVFNRAAFTGRVHALLRELAG